jgi:hypothetical protein
MFEILGGDTRDDTFMTNQTLGYGSHEVTF